ncbi:MAG: hypothetical protein EXS18_08080 [Verrucomicrobiae bacterium]|nr:hypothetical protein [Verrucomicrobiae bacterium]
MRKSARLSLFTGLLAALAISPAAMGQFLPGGGIDTTNSNLPPFGVYLTPADVHAMYNGPGLAIVMSAIQHQPFTNDVHRTPSGPNEIEDFGSQLTGMVSVNLSPPSPITMQGPVQTLVLNKIGNTTGTFQTEMLALSLTGGGVMIRESPTQPSLGETRITDIGGGLYHIDSFFDVFTELSLDGGTSWIPQTGGPSRVNLEIPEPATFTLAVLAGAVWFGRIRRR